MKFQKAMLLCTIAIPLLLNLAGAQGLAADYLRASSIKQTLERQVLHAPLAFHWLHGQKKFWYSQWTQKGKEFVLVDAENTSLGTPAFDQQALAHGLSQASGIPAAPYALPFEEIQFTDDSKSIEFQAYDTTWRFDLSSYRCLSKKPAAIISDPPGNRRNGLDNKTANSPDGHWQAFIMNSNVYIRSLTDQSLSQLSFDGSPGEYYSSDVKWSPDSKKLATYKVHPSADRMVYLIESSPTDQLQPKLHSRNYLKPGDALPHYTPVLFSIEEKRQVPVSGISIDHSFSMSDIVWRNDSRAFTFEYNQRGHQLYEVIEVNAVTGAMKALIKEVSKTFVEYRGKHFRYDVNDGAEIIWASERDGWNHLYLYDGNTGSVKNQITSGKWVVRSVVNVNEKDRSIIFAASGRHEGQDPYLLHYYRINFDGSNLLELGNEDANHLAFFSDDFQYLAETYSRIDLPPIAVLRRSSDGAVLKTLEKADISGVLKTGWKMPEVFSAKGRDDSTDIWGIITRPSNFDPAKKYPVIEYIYAGPQNSFVPKSFISEPAGGDYRSWTALSELAELGFIVVQMDGMGTSNRSKAFHDVCWKNLKDAGFPDRIRWIKSAARKYTYMDTSRVGIYGNSAGGQNSVAALLFHPEFYKVAVSSSGCHDNRMDKMGWNELWMGYPVGPQYEASSNVSNAFRMKGDLLLILGEMDTNVPPESTLQLVNGLIKANKQFDFLIVPGMGHSLGGDYGEHKRRDFFVRHLLGISPPAGTWSN